MKAWLERLGIVLVAVAALGASCGQVGLSILPGVVNDPENRTLRREVFRFATSQLCPELLNRSIPLKLRDEDPSIGRFYPTRCSVHELANEKNLFVQFGGHGYAWTNVTGRMGFEANAAVEYDHDFLMEGSTMYVYFRKRHIQDSAFTPLSVERGSGPVAGVASVIGADLNAVANDVGQRVLESQLARGFTVVRKSDGSASFSLGVLERGQTPFAPFGRGESDWPLLANDRLELHHGQVDVTGPYTVDKGQALWVTAIVEGAPAVDLLVVTRPMADPWLAAYERQPAPPYLPSPIVDDVLVATAAVPGRPAVPYRRPFPLPPGQYYLVFDNSALGGRTSPEPHANDDRAALVSYAVQLGDPP
jgi:hypothetical protein